MQITFERAQKIYSLCLELKDKILPFGISYKIAKLKEAMEKELPPFTNRIQEIISEYGEVDSSGTILVKDEDFNAYVSKIKEVQKTNLIIEDISFSIKEFDSCNLTVEEAQILLPLIRES